MKRTSRIFLAVAILSTVQLSTVNSLWAQNDTSNSVYNQSVYVVGDYNPVLDGVTEKVNVAPAPNDSVADELQPKFKYSITPHRISSLTSATGLKAAKVIGSPTRLSPLRDTTTIPTVRDSITTPTLPLSARKALLPRRQTIMAATAIPSTILTSLASISSIRHTYSPPTSLSTANTDATMDSPIRY